MEERKFSHSFTLLAKHKERMDIKIVNEISIYFHGIKTFIQWLIKRWHIVKTLIKG